MFYSFHCSLTVNGRTAKFEVCSIERENLVMVQISEILRRFVWEKVAGGHSSHINCIKFSDLKMLPFL